MSYDSIGVIVTVLFIVRWMLLFWEFNWKIILVVSFLTPLISYYFFTNVMHVNLPK
ncbi:tripartite tricarboxylate transporter TctB family protein [Thermodesulfobacteriota bacterium]